ncbi:hypothetical protein OF820_00870 [Oceanotoga sp. DSM 15011]|jgi:hypothetical protein|uniref:hypothetical protein n=1 Tax=Oceanotoga TaxID=1255275 RepID=UPI0021F3ED22|nr:MULTISPECIES: hypothetical protein [Oceanotoga]MDN5341646.1 hypothetical protein [Oceanotoga sp.]MDO7977152.1 hypothetical protein [Oceanotoga teriensis]UYP00249.1 hypothetical protein OF820_00870 [Oceanotoga sp. DSM 15011]
MNYYSKSPEEWKKVDEEKNKKRKNKYKNTKKITFLLLIFLSLATLFFIFIGPKLNKFNLEYNVVIDGISFYLRNDEIFNYPDNINVTVEMQNTGNNTKKVKIQDFSFFIIKKDTSKVVYSFLYPQEIETDLNSFQTRLIFDLSKEKEISKLDKGLYEIRASFKYNENSIILKRFFDYRHDFSLNAYTKEDFYLISERPIINFELENITKDTINSTLDGKISIFEKDNKIYEDNFNLGSINIPVMQNKKFEMELSQKFKKGIYNVLIDLNSLKKSIYFNMYIMDKIEEKTDLLGINNFTMSTFEKNQDLYFKGYVENKSPEDKGFIIQNIAFNVSFSDTEEEIYNYSNDKIIRVGIAGYGNKEIFDLEKLKKITLDKIGRYNINFSFTINNITFKSQKVIQVRE